MKILLLSFLFLISFKTALGAQTDSIAARQDIAAFQEELNIAYRNPEKSPLPPEAVASFSAHDFFPVNLSYRVQAKFIRTENEAVFRMKTSTDRLPEYVKYGEAVFELEGKSYKLSIYQNIALHKTEQYKNHLFLPFTDLTNGHQTYGGGRYLDLSIPAGDIILIDFNKAYNPYCAYSPRYSCPVPPRENHLNTPIVAGIKLEGKN
ncbi:DUF1684 domain-containing protein [Pontibacter sp. 13R65]|uniref:DUF1684 domain-containing protein n=1 Tax=Pontibacter sp. 13R65 TaxID=3127458 RepID=UPI00301C18B3